MSCELAYTKPVFFELLSKADQTMYGELRSKVASPENRYNRNKRLATFNEILDEIRKFCEYEAMESWKRYLVCGICWMGPDIAINTRQLRILIAKSKSSINGALAKMGYETVQSKGDDCGNLLHIIPFLKGHFSEMRQWTVRRLTSSRSPPISDLANSDFDELSPLNDTIIPGSPMSPSLSIPNSSLSVDDFELFTLTPPDEFLFQAGDDRFMKGTDPFKDDDFIFKFPSWDEYESLIV